MFFYQYNTSKFELSYWTLKGPSYNLRIISFLCVLSAGYLLNGWSCEQTCVPLMLRFTSRYVGIVKTWSFKLAHKTAHCLFIMRNTEMKYYIIMFDLLVKLHNKYHKIVGIVLFNAIVALFNMIMLSFDFIIRVRYNTSYLVYR